MENQERESTYQFPAWANYLLPAAVILVVGGGAYVPFLFALIGSPTTTAVGYAPIQPIEFSHELHAGELGMDCRYCHSTVESAAFASIPPSQTCMNCHAGITPESEKLKPLRMSFESGAAIEWTKVHDLPDHAYFNHSIHVNKGVGCNTCHGQIDEMPIVRQKHAMSMAWCLDCHRNPEKFVRPRDQVTNMDWDALKATGKQQTELGRELVKEYRIAPSASMEGCAKCHR